MNIGLNLFSVRNWIQTEEDFLKNAERLKNMGYNYFQYSGADFDPERIERVTKAIGIPVFLTHVPLERILNDTDRLMEEHSRFGCKNIGLGMLPVTVTKDERAVKETIDRLNEVAEKMTRNGFTFFYHNHHFEFIRHGEKTVFEYMIENAPYIHFTLDTYWAQYGGMNIFKLLKKLGGRIECVHLKDYKIVPYEENGEWKMKPTFAALGDGNLDLKELVIKMKEAGAKYFFVEQDDAADLKNEAEEIEKSAIYARKEL